MEKTTNIIFQFMNLILNFGGKLIEWIDVAVDSWTAYSNKYSKQFVYALLIFLVLWVRSAKSTWKFDFSK